MTTLVVRLATVAGLSALLAGFTGGTVPRPTEPRSPLAAFGERTAAYAALHREIARELPPLQPVTDLRSLYRTRMKLAAAIKAARPLAQQGDIFTPGVAEVFRALIAGALSGVNSEAFLQDLYEGEAIPAGYRPRVHDVYPEWAVHEVPVVLLLRLPLLPDEIEYRLIDHDLVLWDVDADLIIDVLLDAIPVPTS
jgi:hypothetical protein